MKRKTDDFINVHAVVSISHFILLWGLTLFTGRRLWLNTFHTVVGSHSVYQYTIWLHTFHTIVGSDSVYR
jgi:hypothetical protein